MRTEKAEERNSELIRAIAWPRERIRIRILVCQQLLEDSAFMDNHNRQKSE